MTVASQLLQESQQQILSLTGGTLPEVQLSNGSLPWGGLSSQTLQWQLDRLLLGQMASSVVSPSTLSLYA